MNRFTKIGAVMLASAFLAPVDSARGQDTSDVAAITITLKKYEAALNGSDTSAVMPLYTKDGVFMPQNFPSAVGEAQIKAAYDGVFQALKLNVTFDIVEVVPVSDTYAFARTNSTGTATVLASGNSGPEGNQELFVMQKVGDDWKIARYAFSSTNPPRK